MPDTSGMMGAAGNIISSAITAIGNGIASKKASQRQLKAARETNKMNMELAEKQNQWNHDMWQETFDKTNEYNNVGAQLQRWKDAGLNPNNFGGDSGNASPAALQSADLANQVVPETDSHNQEMVNSFGELAKGAWNLSDYMLRKKKTDAEVNLMQNQSVQVKADTKFIEEKIKMTKVEANKCAKEIDSIDTTIKYTNQMILESRSRQTRMDVQNYLDGKNFTLQQDLAKSLIHLQGTQAALNNKQVDELSQRITNEVKDATLKDGQITAQSFENWCKMVEAAYAAEGKELEFDKIRAQTYQSMTGTISSALQNAINRYAGTNTQNEINRSLRGDDKWNFGNVQGKKIVGKVPNLQITDY